MSDDYLIILDSIYLSMIGMFLYPLINIIFGMSEIFDKWVALISLIFAIPIIIGLFLGTNAMIKNPENATDIFIKIFPRAIIELVNPIGDIIVMVIATIFTIITVLWLLANRS